MGHLDLTKPIITRNTSWIITNLDWEGIAEEVDESRGRGEHRALHQPQRVPVYWAAWGQILLFDLQRASKCLTFLIDTSSWLPVWNYRAGSPERVRGVAKARIWWEFQWNWIVEWREQARVMKERGFSARAEEQWVQFHGEFSGDSAGARVGEEEDVIENDD